MDFPADPPNMSDASLPDPDHLCKALGLPSESVLAVGRGRFDILCELKPAAFDALSFKFFPAVLNPFSPCHLFDYLYIVNNIVIIM